MNKLNDLRVEKNLSRKDIATTLGVTESAVWRLEQDKQDMTTEEFVAVFAGVNEMPAKEKAAPKPTTSQKYSNIAADLVKQLVGTREDLEILIELIEGKIEANKKAKKGSSELIEIKQHLETTIKDRLAQHS